MSSRARFFCNNSQTEEHVILTARTSSVVFLLLSFLNVPLPSFAEDH